MHNQTPLNESPRWDYVAVTGVLLVWVFMLSNKIGTGLIAGLAIFSLTRFTKRWITAFCVAKAQRIPNASLQRMVGWLPTVLTSVIVAAIVLLIGFGIAAAVRFTLKTVTGQGPQLIEEAISNVNTLTASLPDGIRNKIPGNSHDFFEMMRTRTGVLTGYAKNFGGASFYILMQLVFALIMGTSAALLKTEPTFKPLANAWLGAMEDYVQCFTVLMGAQVYVSMWNTFCTFLFMYLVLPLAGVVLPFRELLLMFTAVASLIPAAGNIMSNTLILVLTVRFGMWIAVGSLVYLFVIHKLEYFVNGYIIGRKIHASVPEMLIAIILGETAFGLPGLISGPVTYAFLKLNWQKWEWV
jgi:predicted PurR-regulated permease PerM